ncbi:MAG TPA: hypothetical protein VL092_06320 [Chitinophagaceae bacterium]|nr:hypothetical protein [Chitinophagaceae bacterium]
MKAGFRTEWAIIAGSVVMLLLLLILFGYSHPHSDDYSYRQIHEQKGFWEGSKYLFNHNTGRFLSTALIFLAPLKIPGNAGYQWLTAALFTSFVISLFALLYHLLKEFLSFFQLLGLSAFVLLVFCSFAPNLHEFCFWLSGEATYLAAITLWFWGIILHTLLLEGKYRNNIFINVFTLLHAVAISGVSESGIFLYSLLLVVSGLYRRQHPTAGNRFFYGIVACFVLCATLVLTAAGSQNRFGQTPFSGHLLLALGGGLYASCYWLAQWLVFLLPAVLLYLSVWGRRLLPWSAKLSSFRMFRSGKVLASGLLFFTLCQIAAVWMSGSMPEERYENVLFLFVLLLCCFSAQLFLQEQHSYLSNWKEVAEKRARTGALICLIAVLSSLPNNYSKVVLDLCSGAAAGFYDESRQRDASLAGKQGDVVAVQPMMHQPVLLYYPLLSCDSTVDQQDIPRLAFANYFGKKWIYEYPCSSEAKQYSLKEILKQKRQEFFPERSK